MTNEEAWYELKLDIWVGEIEAAMLAREVRAREIWATVKAKARAKAKAQQKAKAKAQPKAKAKAKAKGKALPKAQPKATPKAVAKALGKAKAKAKAVPHVMARPHGHTLRRTNAMPISAPGSPCSNSSNGTTLVLGPMAQAAAFITVPDSPALGSNRRHGSSSQSLDFYRCHTL